MIRNCYLILSMIVCVCKAVSERQIRQAADRGVVALRDLSRHLGVGTCCGKCVPTAREVLEAQVGRAMMRCEPPREGGHQVFGQASAAMS